MRPSVWLSALAVSAAATLTVSAQQAKTYRARLAPVPIDVSMQATVAGSGTVSATLTGTKLAITGSFEGLKSPATTAQLHKGPVRGVRGPAVAELAVGKGADPTSGTITASMDLTQVQVADLEKGRLYVQLQSEKAPDGNLWGWLLVQENKR
jgi:hypothetical protein